MNKLSLAAARIKSEPRALYQTLRKKISKHFINLLIYFLLTEFVFVFVFPYIFMILNSLKYDFELRDLSKEWILTHPNFHNYSEAIRMIKYWFTLKNNLIVVLFSTLGHVLSCAFVAYGFARFKFRGRNIMFAFAMLSLIVPPQLLIMPFYILYSRLGWMGSFLPIIVPSFFGFGLKGGLFIFIFRQFYKSLPIAYEEAARMEGCGPIKVFWNIILPMSRTSILVAAILSTVWHWNDYFEPQVYLKGTNMLLSQMLPVLNDMNFTYQAGNGAMINPMALAGCFLITLPLLVIYFIFQKQFIQGIEFTGLAN